MCSQLSLKSLVKSDETQYLAFSVDLVSLRKIFGAGREIGDRMGEVLTPGQLKRLTEHKYSVEGCSLIEPYLQRFWKWILELIPLSWAPNAITLTGLIVNVVSTLFLMMYSPDAKQEVPAWALLTCALGLFVYQTLDAIDGKQARRTNSSSPLGELFDHGCDALSIVFVVIGMCIALQLGNQPYFMFFEVVSAILLFYAAHWQTYVSGTLKFGRLDVTEAQFGVISIYVVSALLGTNFWEYKMPVTGMSIKYYPLGISVLIAVLSCHLYFSTIFMEGGVGKNGSTIADTSVLSPMLPITFVVIGAYSICKKSVSHIYENHPCLYLLSFGMLMTKITNKLVVAHMTKSPLSFWDSGMIGPFLLFFNQYCDFFINEYIVLWLCFIYCTGDLFRYSYLVCKEICDYLNIYCFKIKVPEKTKTGDINNGVSGNKGSSADNYTPPKTRSAAKEGKEH